MTTAPPNMLKGSKQILPILSVEKEGEWKGDFTFIQAADTQLGLQERYIEKKDVSTINWDWEIELTKKAMTTINAMNPRPRFVIVCGDLVDAYPGDANRPRQVQDILQAFSHLCPDIPLVCVCGNHDIGDRPNPQSVASYTETFGDDYFAFWVGGVKCLVLNSQFYENADDCLELKEAQDKWLEGHLSSPENAKATHLLVFQHIPWFIESPDEPDQYFNIAPATRVSMLEKLHAAGVRTVFCGHYHRNAGGWYRDSMEIVVTSAVGVQLGADKHGFRVVKVTKDSLTHCYQTLDEVARIQ